MEILLVGFSLLTEGLGGIANEAAQRSRGELQQQPAAL
jgi:hypothetical protein